MAFQGLSEEQLEVHNFGQLRARRRAVHLPDLEVFRALPLLGETWRVNQAFGGICAFCLVFLDLAKWVAI